MNPDPLLDRAETAMLVCTDHSAYRYFLYELRGGLFCGPALTLPDDAIRIVPLTRSQITMGPDLSYWTFIRDELTKHERCKS